METRTIINNTAKILLPLAFGGAILYWMYRDFDFRSVDDILTHGMDWTWMLLSFPFGILAQMFRGWRWRQTLEPIGEEARRPTLVNAVFLSYAASLVVPRVGEFTRCGVLKRYDGVSFAKALGTVVTERAIDTLLMAAVTALTLLMQMKVFTTFFDRTGTSLGSVPLKKAAGNWRVYAVAAVKLLAAPVLVWLVVRLFVTDELLLGVTVILASAPTAMLATLFAISADKDEGYASECVFIGTVLSAVTMPLMIWLLL